MAVVLHRTLNCLRTHTQEKQKSTIKVKPSTGSKQREKGEYITTTEITAHRQYDMDITSADIPGEHVFRKSERRSSLELYVRVTHRVTAYGKKHRLQQHQEVVLW